MLHQPDAACIAYTLAKARARLPHAGSRLDKAAEILADVNTYFAPADPDLTFDKEFM